MNIKHRGSASTSMTCVSRTRLTGRAWQSSTPSGATRSVTPCSPYLVDEDDKSIRLNDIAGILREWAYANPAVNVNLAKCNRTYTRFTTEAVSEILSDLEGAPSGWSTDNHYLYEIINRTGKSLYIQFAISAKMPPGSSSQSATGSMSIILPSTTERTGGGERRSRPRPSKSMKSCQEKQSLRASRSACRRFRRSRPI